MSPQRVLCSVACLFRDQHLETEHQCHLTTPSGAQHAFCGACCLLYFACSSLPADATAAGQPSASEIGSEAT